MSSPKSADGRPGMSLIESLLSLSIFMLILIASLESYSIIKDHFADITGKNEAREAVDASLTRIRLDLCQAGKGLARAISLGLVQAVSTGDDRFSLLSVDRDLEPAAGLVSGQTAVPLASAAGIKRDRTICLIQAGRGETVRVDSVSGNRIIISPPLRHSYDRELARILLLRKVTCFLDGKTGTLRRRVNTGSAQPLMETAASFTVFSNESNHLVRVSLAHAYRKEHVYEMAVVPKNLALPEIR